jgi:uncharacterized protein
LSVAHFSLLVAAGVGAGLTGSIAGLASLVSYPTMLALGFSPLTANVTNTLGLLTNGLGSAAGSREELRGTGPRLLRLAIACGTGGAIGAGLLLLGSSDTFQGIAPWLIAFGAALLLARDRLRAWVYRRRTAASVSSPDQTLPWWRLFPIVAVGIYGGYFGAGAGIIMLAVLSLQSIEPLPVTNSVKNVTMTAANGVAAVIYAFVAPVNWPAAIAIAIGVLVGSRCGPALVRIIPERPLRIAIAVAGFALAIALFAGWPER